MRWLLPLLALGAIACVEPDFELASRVSRPRVLAIVADRPELAPGDAARVHAVLAGVDGASVELRWSMCLGAGTLEAGGLSFRQAIAGATRSSAAS